MIKSTWSCVALAVFVLGLTPSAQGEPYDDAPTEILNAKLSEMTSPPSYNLYVDLKKAALDPIDIWYRLKFDDSMTIVLVTPVYCSRNDSALIRSTQELFSKMPFRPGTDTTLRENGYLIRIGYRMWKGQCKYDSVPDPDIQAAPECTELPELLSSEPSKLPKHFQRLGFAVETKVDYYVNEYGDVCSAYILQSSGWALFDLFALDVAEGWHYRPTTCNGKPIGMWMNWTVAYDGEPPVDSTEAGH